MEEDPENQVLEGDIASDFGSYIKLQKEVTNDLVIVDNRWCCTRLLASYFHCCWQYKPNQYYLQKKGT